jgi:hypothetical protein
MSVAVFIARLKKDTVTLLTQDGMPVKSTVAVPVGDTAVPLTNAPELPCTPSVPDKVNGIITPLL